MPWSVFNPNPLGQLITSNTFVILILIQHLFVRSTWQPVQNIKNSSFSVSFVNRFLVNRRTHVWLKILGTLRVFTVLHPFQSFFENLFFPLHCLAAFLFYTRFSMAFQACR